MVASTATATAQMATTVRCIVPPIASENLESKQPQEWRELKLRILFKPRNERKDMNEKFDDLAKGLAQSVTRRGALKQFGLGLAGLALATFGLPCKAKAGPKDIHCHCNKPNYGCDRYPDKPYCVLECAAQCQAGF